MTSFQSMAPSYRNSVLPRSSVPINGIRTLASMRKRERSAFGARLKQAREKAGLTQPQLAQAVGMSQSTLAEAEGVGHASSFTVRIAQHCGISALWLESGEGDMLDSATWPFSQELMGYVNALNTDELVTLEEVMRLHLRAPRISADAAQAVAVSRVTNSSASRTTSAPAPKARPNLERAYLKDKRASREVGEVPKQGAGRGSKGTAGRG
jgi:transcriptional regulator with XRE-family HTH domain